MQTIDAKPYAPKDKHPKILTMFLNLKIGESMLLVNDHDPKPLYYQFTAEYPKSANLFEQHKIDFCCNGHRKVHEALHKESIINELTTIMPIFIKPYHAYVNNQVTHHT